MLNPLQLRTLQTVVRTGSFADAARELGYTASPRLLTANVVPSL